MVKLQRIFVVFVIIVLGLAFAAGCSGQGAPASGTPAAGNGTDIPPVRSDGSVVAEGKVVPAQYAKLSFSKTGVVAEVLVKEGDQVKKGDLLARLEDSESMKSAVTQAEESLLLAQQALDDLDENYKVDAARVFSTISASYDALREADRQLYYFSLPVNQRNLEMFESAQKMQEQLEKARKAWAPYKYEDVGYGNLNERTRLKKDLENAESDYRTALLRISYASKSKAALADLEKGREDYDKLQNGPDPKKIEAAQARLKNAEAALTAAKASLEDLELRAPFDGTVAKLDIRVGESAVPVTGSTSALAPAVTLADFSQLIVETDNLTEIEVVKISKGQEVSIVADALPDEELKGVVDFIGEVYEEKRGDVTYTVKITLPQVPEKLRWGMTVNTTFKSQ